VCPAAAPHAPHSARPLPRINLSWSATRIAAQQSVKTCFIRGSVIKYVQLPASEVDTELLQDATRREMAQQKQN